MVEAVKKIDVLESYQERFQTLSGHNLGVKSRPFLLQVNLRGDADDTAFTNAVRGVLSLDLPTAPNTWIAHSCWSALWLGPDEWLLVGEKEEQADMIGQLETRLRSLHIAVVDVSGQRTVVDLSGPSAYELLAAGCSLDLHPRYFKTGHCAQTLLGKADVILQRRNDYPTFRIFVRCSFARYLAAWLIDALELMRESRPSGSE